VEGEEGEAQIVDDVGILRSGDTNGEWCYTCGVHGSSDKGLAFSKPALTLIIPGCTPLALCWLWLLCFARCKAQFMWTSTQTAGALAWDQARPLL